MIYIYNRLLTIIDNNMQIAAILVNNIMIVNIIIEFT